MLRLVNPIDNVVLVREFNDEAENMRVLYEYVPVAFILNGVDATPFKEKLYWLTVGLVSTGRIA